MDKNVFKDPKSCKKTDVAQSPFWFWNDKLEKEELLRQLKLMSEKGIKNIIPHGRHGFIGEYLDDTWFENIELVLEHKRKNNEITWIYDEINWPAGTCDRTITQNEEFREQYLDFNVIHLKKGELYRYLCLENTINVTAHLEETSIFINLINDYKVGWTGIEYLCTEDCTIYEVNIKIDQYIAVNPLSDSDLGQGSNAVNYLNKEATIAFLDSTYEKYYERFKDDFGSVIKAFFNDETRLCNTFPWTQEFAKKFIELKKYDIRPLLHSLLIENDEAGRIRCDYFDVVAHLYQQNYIKVIAEWCEERNVGLAAHLLNEETLAGQVRYNGDFMRQLKYMTLPGIDHLGKGIGSLNAKFGSSAARNNGKNDFHCEVFAGCGWDMTMYEAVRMTSWLFQQGVQIIINHAFFYSDREERANDWPPSQFFQWKEWDKMETYNSMLRRLYHMLADETRFERETLVYNPVESFWFNYIGNQKFKHGYLNFGPKIEGKRALFIDNELQKIMTGLQDFNIDFNVFSSDVIENFKVENGMLINILTEETYKVFILPMTDIIPIALMRLLEKFVENGGQLIVVDSLPKYAINKEEDEELHEILNKLKEKIQLYSVREIEKIVERINLVAPQPIKIIEGISTAKHSKPCYGDSIEDPYLHGGEDVTGLLYSRFIKGNNRNYYMLNLNDKSEKITMEVESKIIPELWNPLTGLSNQVEILDEYNGKYLINIELDHGYGSILVTTL